MSSEDTHSVSGDKPKKKRSTNGEEFPLQEYRLVPVEEWEARQSEGDEIDLVELAKHIWDRRKFIAKVTGVFVILGLLVALLSPVEYQTSATLLPEAQSAQSGAGSLLQQYGGLLGIGGNISLGQEGTIPPQLYPQIVQSLPFQLELLNTKVHFTEFDTTTTVYNFFDEVYTPSVFSYIVGYSIGLPGVIKSLFSADIPEQPLPKGFEADSIISITKEQLKIIENMRERVTISLSEETGVVNLTVEMPDPVAAARVGAESIHLLKEYVINYRTRKAESDLAFAQEQLDKAQQRFQEAQVRLAEFRDSNTGQLTARAQTQVQRFQSEYDLAFNVYNTLAQRVEQAKLKVQEQTPVVTILNPVQMPIEKESPKRKLILVVCFIIGVIFALVYSVSNYILNSKRG